MIGGAVRGRPIVGGPVPTIGRGRGGANIVASSKGTIAGGLPLSNSDQGISMQNQKSSAMGTQMHQMQGLHQMQVQKPVTDVSNRQQIQWNAVLAGRGQPTSSQSTTQAQQQVNLSNSNKLFC